MNDAELRAFALGIRVPADGLLPPKQAAAILGRSSRTLWRLRRSDTGPEYVRRGGRFLYPIESLQNWLDR